MNILITNDDGVKAEGIKVLAKRLSEDGHNILVIAPSRERSATSHAATFGKPLYIEEYHGIEGVRAFSLSGKPVDCVKFGCIHFSDFGANLVISGINRGQNVGTDIVYSGTVSAAQEGALLGVNSIAISCEYSKNKKTGKYNYDCRHIDYTLAADFLAKNLDYFVRHKAPDTFFNVNVPDVPVHKGVKAVRHGYSKYDDYYKKEVDENGKEYFVLLGEHSDGENAKEECDLKYFLQGYITVTPIFYNRTNTEKLKQMGDITL